MNKLVVKTICITIAVIFLMVSVLFGFFSVFFPSTIANVADGLGNYSVGIFYYEKQYTKSNDINDLFVFIKKLDIEKSASKMEEYCEKLISSKEFASFCKKQDQKSVSSLETTAEYVYGKYCLSLFAQDKREDALSVAYSYIDTSSYGYTKFNPLSTIILNHYEDLGKKVQTIIDKLDGIKENYSGEQRTNIDNDLTLLNSLK